MKKAITNNEKITKIILSRCEDFLLACEADFTPIPCCHVIFNAKPIFTSHGTCFSSQLLLKPSIKSPLKIVMNVSKAYSQGTCRKFASTNTSRLEAHAGFFKLLKYEGDFDPYVL